MYPARKTVEVARTAGRGWIDYRWTNPQTKLVEAKSTYVEKLGDRYAIGVGIYKDEQVNRNTVSIISGSPGSDATYLQVAYDLAAVLNDGENLRILPVVGVGGSQNIRDVRALKGIDIGLTQVSILNNFRRVNETLGVTDDKIVYITKLFNLEVHLVGRSNIGSIEQLKGQKVNLDELGSGTNYSMRDVFTRLGVEIQEVNLPQTLALEKVKSGEIAATVLVAGKPTLSMSRLRRSAKNEVAIDREVSNWPLAGVILDRVGPASVEGTTVEWPGGLSSPGSPRTVREPLDSYGSRCSAISMT